MSFIREKMRSASDVSSGISSMMATRRSADMYSPEKVTSMCDHSDLNGLVLVALGLEPGLLLAGTRLPPARWLAVAVHRAAVSLRNARRSWRVCGNAPGETSCFW